jgi:uncharacterized metal-binding protein YceD (DUF177 family)
MKTIKEFDIPFVGLKEGKHRFDYQIDNAFFEAFNYDEYNNANVNVTVILDKKSTMLELAFKIKGAVNVNCDLSNEPYDQKIKSTLNLIVKYGDEYNNENEDLLIIPHGEHTINISQYIYEMIILSVPAKRIHPGIKDGSLSSAIIEKLEELQPTEDKINKNEETDPRWDKLKKLLTDK